MADEKKRLGLSLARDGGYAKVEIKLILEFILFLNRIASDNSS